MTHMGGCWWHHAMSPLPCTRTGPAQPGLCVVPLCHVQGACAALWNLGVGEGPVQAIAVLLHHPELHTCGRMGPGPRASSPHPQATCCSTQHSCGVSVRVAQAGQEPPIVTLSLILQMSGCLPAWQSAGRAVTACQGLLRSSHCIDWPCHHLEDVSCEQPLALAGCSGVGYIKVPIPTGAAGTGLGLVASLSNVYSRKPDQKGLR